MTSIYSKRLTKELKGKQMTIVYSKVTMLELHRNPPEGVVVEEADNFLKWTLCLTGAPGSIYEKEEFKLQVKEKICTTFVDIYIVSIYTSISIRSTRRCIS
ncbi:unnamed protein product [Rhizopus stolonifer]